MKKILYLTKVAIIGVFFILTLSQCNDDDNTTYRRPETAAESIHPNDVYLKTHLLEPYGTAARWRWDNRFIQPTQSATPIKADNVIPVTKVLEHLWIGVYESAGEQGKKFMKELLPAELQYIGSYIYQEDGSILLGYAEGGARITLLNLNSCDLTNREWLTNPGGGILSTVHHEFSHIVHQNYGLPSGFKGVSDYTGNGWINLPGDGDEAIKRGVVSNYGTLNEFEDFCELISHFLTMPKVDFEKKYILEQDCSNLYNELEEKLINAKTDEAKEKLKKEYAEKQATCEELNVGRAKIEMKLNMLIDFYREKFGIDLVSMRETLQSRLNYVVENNEIPE